MRLSRFFIDAELQPGQQLQLPSPLVNYIVNVLRLKTNDNIVLFNGRSQEPAGEFAAHLTEVSKRKVLVQLCEFIEKDIESPLNIHLFQGISRSERMDFTIQKSVELGVTEITPVFTERSMSRKLKEKQLLKKQLHWQSVADSACEQSGRTHRVMVHSAIKTDDMIIDQRSLCLLLAPGAKQGLTDLKHQEVNSVSIFIGPEGGLSPQEIEQAIQKGYQGVRLGPRVLRTETASLTALSVIQFLWGDLS